MTREEVKRIVAVLKYNYLGGIKDADVSLVVDAWADTLADEDAQLIGEAVKRYCKSGNTHIPRPGQLIQMATPKAEMLNEMQAWALVRKAIENGIYGAEAEFAKLPPEVQQAVGDPGQLRAWAMTDLDSLQTVAQSNFQRTYRAVVKRAEDDRLLLTAPEKLRIESEDN